LYIVHRDCNMSKSPAYVAIAVCNLVVRVILSAIVMREFDDTLSICPMVSVRGCLRAVECEEV